MCNGRNCSLTGYHCSKSGNIYNVALIQGKKRGPGKIPNIPPEVKTEWLATAILGAAEEEVEVESFKESNAVNWRGYGVELCLMATKEDIERFPYRIEIEDEKTLSVIVEGRKPNCYLCGTRGHIKKECPLYEFIAEYEKELEEKKNTVNEKENIEKETKQQEKGNNKSTKEKEIKEKKEIEPKQSQEKKKEKETTGKNKRENRTKRKEKTAHKRKKKRNIKHERKREQTKNQKDKRRKKKEKKAKREKERNKERRTRKK
ncbi:XP_014783152.1PREDICTED: uncharacterized protein LOC106878453 [Octopus vulgaris]|uniref:XP_014783152.1PREDICTED: uncharacterized protein LOC106878453 n=1 Tax=Octopus vulgaris TaxID=6645 RepID=A0AA36ARR6_OCTVU|nr:XP_014783152.1PREDICTED: uncharacterized protein LOC106878453 [Octopus vulgaris]